MISSSLQPLHNQFSQAFQEKIYMGIYSESPEHLVKTATKTIPLYEVYQRAQEEIVKELENTETLKAIPNHVDQLRLLERDGDIYYIRYCEKTGTWLRSFLKGLAYYTPRILKNFLPRIFSNGMEEAEKRTKTAYETYRNYLKGRIEDLTSIYNTLSNLPSNPNHFSTDPSPSNNSQPPIINSVRPNATSIPISLVTSPQLLASSIPTLLPIPALEVPALEVPALEVSIEKTQACHQKIISKYIKNLKDQVTYLNLSENRLSTNQWMKALVNLKVNLQHLFILAPELNQKELLNEIGIDTHLIPYFTLTSSPLFQALLSNNKEEVAILLKPTEWGLTFEQAFQAGYIQFGVSQRHNTTFLQLVDEKGSRIQERSLVDYKKAIRIQPALFSTLTELNNQLIKHPACRPCSLKIIFEPTTNNAVATDNLNTQTFELILKLSESIPSLSLSGLKEINLKQLNVSPEQEKRFIEIFPYLECPHLTSLVLTDHSKEAFSSEQLSALLQAFPSKELIKMCLLSSSHPQEMTLPISLMQINDLDLRGYPFELVPFMLHQCSQVKTLILDQDALTDQHLQELFQSGCFQHLNQLTLKGCQKLTTDALLTLTQITSLTNLVLPELKIGTYPLNQLPLFDDPFKIKLFYTQTALTRPYASHLYTGLLNWAVLFQIPLAKAQATQIFSEKHTTLDFRSVACWLYKQDYRHLQPQPSTHTIIADNCEYLNDHTLIEFIQKFPNVTHLSLYNCPHLTDQGMITLLQAYPKIEYIDLTGCQGITNDLLLNHDKFWESHSTTTLVTDGTLMTRDVINIFKEKNSTLKLLFNERRLRVTNEELIDENALERILANKNLNHLRHLDFENCTNLTDAALSRLLDRLNTEQKIFQPDGTWQDNPQRLNLAVLNLTGCTGITEKAFDETILEDKVMPKHLETLNQVISGGTNISPLIKEIYPIVTFQEAYEPLTFNLKPSDQLNRCYAYVQQQKERSFNSETSSEIVKLAHSFIWDRIAIELFKDETLDPMKLNQVESFVINPNADHFKDILLSFKTEEDSPISNFLMHKELLYCQSKHLRMCLRSGCEEARSSSITFINQNATPAAAQALIHLMQGTLDYNTLDWQIAAEVAELGNAYNFQLNAIHYKKLLTHIQNHFNLENADDILLRATRLEDKELKTNCEAILIALADTVSCSDFDNIDGLAQSHALSHLQIKIAELRDYQLLKMEQQLILDTLSVEEEQNQYLFSQYV